MPKKKDLNVFINRYFKVYKQCLYAIKRVRYKFGINY